ncbi:MAG: hypothetical protein L3K13_08480 [Thermoplasmata archaeon]|nr:hypothetical protein [Thermoplasmata archaeon]
MGDAASPAEIERRVVSLLRVAEEHRSGVSAEDLTELLPEDAPTSVREFATWLEAHPAVGVLGPDGEVSRAGALQDPEVASRQKRAIQYALAAEWLMGGPFATLRPYLRCAALTGSVAYGRPEEGDDCDLMLVTRPGSLWVVLALAFLRLRGARASRRGNALPEFCLNYVLDERAAEEDYTQARGLLFAREALSVQILVGASYYRSLLERANWLEREAPRLYSRWTRESAGPLSARIPAVSLGIRLLNWALYPWLAAYLQGKGLLAGHRLRGSGQVAQQFRTITRPGRLSLKTLKFERLRSIYAGAPALP